MFSKRKCFETIKSVVYVLVKLNLIVGIENNV